MTVTLSYNYGFQEDCGNSSISNYTETEDGLTAALTSEKDNQFKIDVTVAAGNKTVVYEYDCTNISTDTYAKYRFLYKTSSGTIKAKIVLVFTVDSQTILDEVSSTSLTLVTGDVTAGKTLDKVQFWATQDTGQVYYDFLSLYEDDFSLGNTNFGMDMDFPQKHPILSIPSSWTDRTQILGSGNTVVRIGCDLTQNTWKRGPSGSPTDAQDGDVFLDMIQNMSSYPWRWFNSGKGRQFKATVHPHFYWNEVGGATVRRLDLEIIEYSRGDLSGYGYTKRWGVS